MESADLQSEERTGDRLGAEAERLEQLLAELERSSGPTTWTKVEEVVHRLLSLHGAGLERILSCLREADALTPALEARLCADELVAHLLLLHGLHPVPLERRVTRALEEVRPYLRSHAGGVELLGIDPDGAVRLRLEGSCRGCHSSQATVEHTLRRAIEDAAPEITAVRVETAADLVPLKVQTTRTSWRPVLGLPTLAEGGRHVTQIDGVRVLFLELGGALLAYRESCRCGEPLEHAGLQGTTLTCAACGLRFDVARGGRGLDKAGGLTPIPLLSDANGIRIALAEAPR